MIETNERELRQHLIQMALGYWRSQVLFTATELGFFVALKDESLPAATIAARCRSAPLHTERLLHACVTLGLMTRVGDEFACSPLASTFLVPNAVGYLGDWIGFMSDCYGPWGQLEHAIRTGDPVERGLEQLSSGERFTRQLILAMDDYGQGPARQLVSRLDLSGHRRLLDVGGGAGTYSMLLAERFPELETVVFDLPPASEISREAIDRRGFAGRVRTQPGDYLVDDLGEGYDVVLLSNMLHQEDPETCKLLLRKARVALRDGGLLVINSAVLNPDRDGPEWSVLMSLQLFLFYRGGRVYTVEELRDMLEETGFVSPEVHRASLLSAETMLLATKPAAASPLAELSFALAER